MTCSEAELRLDDFVDGALGEREFQELELHLAGCDACRRQERDLRALLEQASALPRELSPSRDLWPGVAARLGPRSAFRFPWRSPALSGWLPATLAAAAALAVAFVWLGRPDRTTDAKRQAATAPSGFARPAGFSPEPGAMFEAEREYAQATSALLAALEQRREQLAPETLRAVERDLQVIDEALAEIRKALAQDPASGPLNHLLASTHQKKVKALQRVEKLSRI
jgi:tetratricopeptide (TPR) repeat protein